MHDMLRTENLFETTNKLYCVQIVYMCVVRKSSRFRGLSQDDENCHRTRKFDFRIQRLGGYIY